MSGSIRVLSLAYEASLSLTEAFKVSPIHLNVTAVFHPRQRRRLVLFNLHAGNRAPRGRAKRSILDLIFLRDCMPEVGLENSPPC